MIDSGKPKSGLFEKLLSVAEKEELAEFSDSIYSLSSEIDPEDRHAILAQYLGKIIDSSLEKYRGKDAPERQQRLVRRISAILAEELNDSELNNINLTEPLQRLLYVGAKGTFSPTRPDTPLSRSALLTGTRLDPSLGLQLQKEIATADYVDILVSFIKWSGVRLVIDALENLTKNNSQHNKPRLRLITTSYMGATDPRAIETLADMPNTEIRVSYDTKRTRLHAKAYIIHRKTGFGSAYIGSANLSHTALSEGLEWTQKVSQYELPYLWSKLTSTFETYWNDDEFELFDTGSSSKFRGAVNRENRKLERDDYPQVHFNLLPYPYQEEILDVLTAEREIRNKCWQLIIAATGTGKTMVSAFDFKRWSTSFTKAVTYPSLLYIAHREEILKQALGTFRAVLRDQNFGDLLVGGLFPDQQVHLFCSIQSYNSKGLWNLPPDHFDYVVVDEFHHAEANSYKKLLNHIKPKIVLGMTATPERADGLDVFHWFDDEASTEIRLPDAINRRLLCPFHYFGVSDSVDLSKITWKRGKYDLKELEGVYTGNDLRAGLIFEKVREIVLDTSKMRALGFCVSVKHANFMARFFNENGINASSLSSESNASERQTAQNRLVHKKINILFVVDLYNEGIDIPEIDTVLFLRPTESLTVFLQQFGRGLRLIDDKDCLTVLDFVGNQNKHFRFANQFRALLYDPTSRIDQEIEQGFPHLPSGCVIKLERIAKERILENIRQTLTFRRPTLIAELKQLGRHLGRNPSIKDAIQYLQVELDELLKRGLWSRLLHEAELVENFKIEGEKRFAKGIRRLAHIDDIRQIRFLLEWFNKLTFPKSPIHQRRLTLFFISLFGKEGQEISTDEGIKILKNTPTIVNDVISVLQYHLSTMKASSGESPLPSTEPLALHASYTRDEILVGLGHWTMGNRPEFREGVLHLPNQRFDVFFITLHKTEAAYSPTTMYEDYAISDELFHWQSQSTTSAESPTGQRYIHHHTKNYTPILFVREKKRSGSGLSIPYQFLGPAEYVSHEGSRPMSIIWRVKHKIPVRLLRKTARQAII
ncbi:DUF3427 domain-containing protein [bacterium]|nr:DUF3427 domain-containing protein [bacterium]